MSKKAAVAERARTVASKGGKKQAEPRFTDVVKAAPGRPGVVKGERKLARSARTGKAVSPATAAADPDGTVVETVKDALEDFASKFKPPSKIPKNFGAAADLLYQTRERRLKLAKIVDSMEEFEKSLKKHFIENLSKKESTGAAGKIARAQIVTEDQPVVQDWEAAYKHIKKTGSFDLLNRAINRTAVKARWDNGKEVPGVGHFQVTKVSVTKV